MSITATEVRVFGGPEVLTPVSLPAPVPGPGEAVIAVSVADVLFLDTMIRSGRARDAFPQRPPYIPGNGVAGHLTAAGDGVDPARHARGGFAPVSVRAAAERGVTVRGIEAVQSPPGRHEELIRNVLAAAPATRLRPVIGQVFPLEWAADAHAALAARSTIGKTLLTTQGSR
jgi:NADPH:quinone reductase-like Zn-dependent oxidoreductase